MNDKTIVIATRNAGKIKEFKRMLEDEYNVLTLADLRDFIMPEENGLTFEENALLKAQAVTDRYNVMAIADDSGLVIDAFHGFPGIYSARYLGHDTPYSYKNRIILERLEGETNRSCKYICAIALTRPAQPALVFTADCQCRIALKPAGHSGFGYDPIMFYAPYNKTMAEMSRDEKDGISHRGKALAQLRNWLNENK